MANPSPLLKPTLPVTLDGTIVRLEPLEIRHAADLFVAGEEATIWTWLTRGPFADLADVEVWIRQAHDARERGEHLPFAIVHRADGRAIGSTRYLDIQPESGNLEIGWTWLGAAHQRTAVNTECKWLLLRHAFEILGAVRVQLKTDLRNERSQRAIERLGAVREGVLRRSRVTRGGYIRDTVVYSILAEEWPAVGERLAARLRREG